MNEIIQNTNSDDNFRLIAVKNRYIPEGVSYAIVDIEDYDYINQFNWNVTPAGYVTRSNGLNNQIHLHRDIIRKYQSLDDNLQIDHKNCNKLDNRKENLRICTVQENAHNKLLLANNTSGFKGVSMKKINDKTYWKASIKSNYESCEKNFPYTNIGLFQAAAWYDFKAKELHKEFAKTNAEIYNISELAYINFGKDNYQNNLRFKGIFKYQKNKKEIYWHAFLSKDDQTVLNELFPYTDKGLRNAIEITNQKLIELYGHNTELNTYNYLQIQENNENQVNTIIQKLSDNFDFIYDGDNIIQIKLKKQKMNNIDINNIQELPNLATHSQAQSNYYGVHYAKSIRQHPDGTDYFIENWQAVIRKNNQVIFRKLFPYTETGKILAAEAINEKLIEFYGPNTRLNIIDKTNFSEEEAKQIQSLKTTSPYRGVAQYIRKYKTSSGEISQKTVWAATITVNKRKGEKAKVYTKHFPFTPQGERDAALWYNEKAKEYFKDKAVLNIIKEIDNINELENKEIYINKQTDTYKNMGVDKLKCIRHIRKPRKALTDGTPVFKDYWYANIRSNGKQVLSKYFEYNDEGRKAAIDLTNQKLIELYGPDTKLNKY